MEIVIRMILTVFLAGVFFVTAKLGIESAKVQEWLYAVSWMFIAFICLASSVGIWFIPVTD